VDGAGRFVAVSAACEEVFGYTQEEMIGLAFIDMVHPDDRARTLQAAAGVMAGQPLRNFENRYLHKDGRVIDIMWSARWSEADQLRLAIARDITARKRSETMQAALYAISEAAHSAEGLDDLFAHIHRIIGGMLPSQNFCVALYDDSEQLSFPYALDERQAMPAESRLDPKTPIGQVIRNGSALLLTQEAIARHWRGRVDESVVDWLGIPLIADQRTIGALVVQSYALDIRYSEQDKALLQFVSTQIAANIERKRSAARMRYMAEYDMLTGLPNRTLFDDRLLVALAKANRSQQTLALLYIDLDNFKPVNDNYGHAAGDLLLQEVATRIQACVRESDTISRIGGDEFIALLDGLQADENAIAVANNICRAINLPFNLPRQCLQISASIGVALYPSHGSTATQLMRQADAAMYDAKRAGGNRSASFAA